MAAGTLSVMNNSKAVVGVGTTFTAFASGDFLSLVVGQVPYTVAIASVESDTALTLVLPFDGPTATGLAWDGVKRDTMSLATMGVTVQAQKALRLMIADENNWRAIFGDAEEITVTLPNGQVMQGMSWGYLSELMKQIDPVEMRNLQQQAAASEAAAQGFRDEAEGIKNETNTIKTQTDQIKADTQAIKDQTNQIKTDTGVMRDEANTAKSDAQAASTAAQGFRDQAEELAQSINPDNLLTKSGNLAGLTDKTQAWLNVRPDGATPLAGDPVGDYDATTKRWVQNIINSGTVGPTMNGVMNYGVGSRELWQSRAYIPPYALPLDGQIVNRADWPELWAHAQMHGAIPDAEWQADTSKRSLYSTGNGTTTFRLPDLNGIQVTGQNGITGPSSIKGLFGRGDSGIASGVAESGAPEIAGEFIAGRAGGADGSFATGPSLTSTVAPGTGNEFKRTFNASLSSPVYGRSPSEIRPNCFYATWIVRASGGFVAANTQWSVINADATRPGDGTVVDGGNVYSLYKVNNVTEAEARFRARADIGGNYYARISVTNSTTQRSAALDFDETGTLRIPNNIVVNSIESDFFGALNLTRYSYPRVGFQPTYADGNAVPDTVVGGHTFFECSVEDSGNSRMHLWRRRKDGDRAGEIDVIFPKASGTLALQGTSGFEYKKNIVDADYNEAMGRINGQRLVNFVYKDDEQERVRFGIIAEEAELIAPQYIKHNMVPYEDIIDEDGNKIGEKTRDRPSVDVNPIVMDLMGCVQHLNKQVEQLKAEIETLKK